MDLNRFNADDIHELRLAIADEYSRMTPEEAEADHRRRVETFLSELEALHAKPATA